MIKIYLPNTPSKFVGDAKIFKVKKVRMTCAGGIGGSSWYEYIVDFPEHFNGGMLNVTNYKGEKMMLNTRHVVKVSDSQVVGITTDSQNSHYSGIKTNYYETPIDDNVVLHSDYGKTEVNGVKWLESIDFKEKK